MKIYDYLKFNLNNIPTGEFGIEIEAEGEPKFATNEKSIWSSTIDGSLKDPHAKEYILRKPLPFKEAVEAVKLLYAGIGQIRESMRAGVHVHLNVLELEDLHLMNLLTCYYCLEDSITNTFGEDRVGNLFCLRLSDADFMNNRILDFIKTRNIHTFSGDNIRYSALNLNAITKFGSIEFRAMKTPMTPEPIISWLSLLKTMKENSKKFNSPREIIHAFSADGEEQMVKRILGEFSPLITNQNDYKSTIISCIRNIQFWALSTNWENFNNAK